MTVDPLTVTPGAPWVHNQCSIGDVLLDKNVSWRSYNDQWDRYLSDKYQLDYGKVGALSDSTATSATAFSTRRRSWPTTKCARRTSSIPISCIRTSITASCRR